MSSAGHDFKYYNNSYLYVTFRKEYLDKDTSNKLAVRLLKNSRKDIIQKFYEESANQNNDTRYEKLRALKREIEKAEKEKNPPVANAKPITEPEMELEEQLKFAEKEEAFIKEYQHQQWLKDQEMLKNNITITEINVTQTLSLTKLFKSYCIFNVSDKMSIKATHRKVARILIQDPSVLAVEFLAN